MPEMLDIVDENGVPTGQSVPRTTAHAEGLRHRTSHVWIVRRKNGRVQVLLQMRCAAKDSYPGCYDISSAGHIPAGAEFVGSALRELREELGVTAAPADLHECGLRRFRFEAEFHGKPFKDNQVSKVFCLWLDREAEDFAVQKSEIDYVKWFDLDEAVAAVEQGTIPNCIFPEELGMVKKFVGLTGGRLLTLTAAGCGHPALRTTFKRDCRAACPRPPRTCAAERTARAQPLGGRQRLSSGVAKFAILCCLMMKTVL